uniref:Uncharacterized protein n=1 Tax=Manihot esculenta TaxID=3983 RepID=A0A2C9UCW3_MANES
MNSFARPTFPGLKLLKYTRLRKHKFQWNFRWPSQPSDKYRWSLFILPLKLIKKRKKHTCSTRKGKIIHVVS